MDVRDLDLYLVDPQIAEERLELKLLVFLAGRSFFLVLLLLLFTLTDDNNLVIAQVQYFLILFRFS